MELVSGIATVVGAKKIYMRQKTEWDTTGETPIDKGSLFPLTANGSGVINLAFTPKEAVANILVYEATDDCGTPMAMGSATLVGKVLTIAAAANKKVVVYYSYDSSATAESFTIDSAHFSGTYKLVGDTVVRNVTTGKDESFQVVIPNLKWSSNLNLDFKADGDPTPTTFECEIMRDATSATLIEMTKY